MERVRSCGVALGDTSSSHAVQSQTPSHEYETIQVDSREAYSRLVQARGLAYSQATADRVANLVEQGMSTLDALNRLQGVSSMQC